MGFGDNMAEESIYIQQGPDAGRIEDPNVAREIANLERPARDRELGLEVQARTGLTENEKFHLELMAGVREHYPHAFESTIDPQGREVMRLRYEGQSEANLKRRMYLTQEGVISMFFTGPSEETIYQRDDELMIELDKIKRWQSIRGLTFNQGTMYDIDQRVQINLLGLENPAVRDFVKKRLIESEEMGKELSVEESQKTTERSLKAAKDELFG